MNVLYTSGQMRIVVFFVSVLRRLLNAWRLFIVLFLLAEPDCQSKLFFSSLAVFPFCNRKGALSQVQSHRDMFAADYSSEMEQNREECEQRGIQNLPLRFQVQSVLLSQLAVQCSPDI